MLLNLPVPAENQANNPPALKTLERAIKTRIKDFTHGNVCSITIQAAVDRMVVSGFANSYYQKQLALQAVLEVLGDHSSLQIDLQIEVMEPIG